MIDLFKLGYTLEAYMPRAEVVVTNPKRVEYIVNAHGCDCPARVEWCKHRLHLQQLANDQIAAWRAEAVRIDRAMNADRTDRKMLHMGAKPHNVLSPRDVKLWREFSRLNDKIDDLSDAMQAIQRPVEMRRAA